MGAPSTVRGLALNGSRNSASARRDRRSAAAWLPVEAGRDKNNVGQEMEWRIRSCRTAGRKVMRGSGHHHPPNGRSDRTNEAGSLSMCSLRHRRERAVRHFITVPTNKMVWTWARSNTKQSEHTRVASCVNDEGRALLSAGMGLVCRVWVGRMVGKRPTNLQREAGGSAAAALNDARPT